jgi:DNA-binding NarL/FixJ family response regulator
VRILLVDDHEIVREGFVSTLREDPRYEIVGAVSSGAEAIRRAKQTLPEVAVVDIRLPDTTGMELCRALRALLPSISLIILSSYLSEETVREALAAGAVGYVTKAAGLEELRQTLGALEAGDPHAVSAGASQIVMKLHDVAARQAGSARATPQQQRVLELAAEGLTNDEIAQRLFIAESTVRFHLQKLKAKLGARTKTDLVALAMRAGWIAPADEDSAMLSETPEQSQSR